MKRILVIGTVVAILSLGAAFAVPAFADSPTEGDSGTPDQQTWQAMHEACEDGDWQAMAETAEEVHKYLGDAPCHSDEYPATDDGGQTFPNRWGGMSGHMGGGMMGGGWGGMM